MGGKQSWWANIALAPGLLVGDSLEGVYDSVHMDATALRLDHYKTRPNSWRSVPYNVEDHGKEWMWPHIAADRASDAYPNQAGLPDVAVTAAQLATTAAAASGGASSTFPASPSAGKRVLVVGSNQFSVNAGNVEGRGLRH